MAGITHMYTIVNQKARYFGPPLVAYAQLKQTVTISQNFSLHDIVTPSNFLCESGHFRRLQKFFQCDIFGLYLYNPKIL